MTLDQKKNILEMRSQGLGYKRIAAALQMSENTVKTFLRRNKDAVPQQPTNSRGTESPYCPQCGKAVKQKPGRKAKRFCSTDCRMLWWNSHPEQISRKSFYTILCAHCGESFVSYSRSDRRYCCRECYLNAVKKAVIS